MTPADALGQLAAGLRLALILLAVMSLLTRVRPEERAEGDTKDARRLNAAAWTLFACSVLAFSPIRTAELLGNPASAIWTRLADLTAAALACAVFVVLFAARGRARGLSVERVGRGVLMNLTIILAIVGVTWVTR